MPWLVAAVLSLAALPPPAESTPGSAAVRVRQRCLTDYQPGGEPNPHTFNVSLGGFTNVALESTTDGTEFALEDLNFLLVSEPDSWLRVIVEIQSRDLFVAEREHVGVGKRTFAARRFFVDAAASNEVHLRAGTFLTPIGYWNTVVAPPLTWTTEPPQVIENSLFQTSSTGLMLSGSRSVGQRSLGYAAFAQFLQPLSDDPEFKAPDVSGGLRLEYGLPLNWGVGATYALSKFGDRLAQLAGLHALWQPREGEIACEFVYEEGGTAAPSQWGLYLQGVYPLGSSFSLVGRYEHYDPASKKTDVRLSTLGTVFRPWPSMALKLEYRISDDVADGAPNGLFSSFATFF